MSTSSAPDPQPRRTVAAVRSTWWPGWIWAVPVAAVGIVMWLLVRAISDRGIDATVVFDEAAGMKIGDTQVTHRGMKVGTLRRIELAPDGWHVVAELNLDKSVRSYLRSGTHFYLVGAHPSLSDPASLKAIVSGPSIVLVAGQGAAARHFNGVVGPVPEPLAAAVPYTVRFSTAVGQLQEGSPVSLLGFTVGEVAKVQLMTDAADGKITGLVTLVLDPTRFHIQRTLGAPGAVALMNATLADLVRHGLRARLTQDPPLIGAQRVTLEMMSNEEQGKLMTNGLYPEIPVQEGGGIQQVLARAGQLPIGEIGENVRAITAQLKTLVSSPQLKDGIDRLDDTLAVLDKTVHEAAPQIAPTLASIRQTVDSLRKTANEIDATAAAARGTIGGRGISPNGNLQQTLRELSDAARAIRSLANDLDQYPESLIEGRRVGK